MRLLDLVEEDHRIRTAANLLGKLPAFFVANVSGRRADQSRYCVPLHVLGHVNAHHRMFIVKQEFGQSPGQLGFADAGWTEENERSNRALEIA